MYHPTTRVLTVLELLQSHRQMSGPRLAERLEVDVRSIRRYIMMLQDLGIPIETERGRYGSYRLMRGFKLPPLMFTEEEALALTLGLLLARRLGMALTAPAVEGALAKIDRVLPEALRTRVRSLQDALVLDPRPSERTALASAPGSTVVLTFSAATQQASQVWIRYQSGRGEQTGRLVDPYGMVFYTGLWYAIGYCHLRQGLRVFRLDRVLHIELREGTFTRPSDFNVLAYLRSSIARMPGTWKVEVLLRMPLAEAEQRVSPTIAELEEAPGGVILRCYAEELDWLARFLVNLNCPFIIHEPTELRAALRALAEQIVQLAECIGESQPDPI